jgi:hypothetical protein
MSIHKQNKIKLIEGKVDLRLDHIELIYGENKDPVARVGPRSRNTFVYELLIDNTEIVSSVMKELNYYLIELNEEDPWLYAQYHCTTASNILYSKVHWCNCKGEGLK